MKSLLLLWQYSWGIVLFSSLLRVELLHLQYSWVLECRWGWQRADSQDFLFLVYHHCWDNLKKSSPIFSQQVFCFLFIITWKRSKEVHTVNNVWEHLMKLKRSCVIITCLSIQVSFNVFIMAYGHILIGAHTIMINEWATETKGNNEYPNQGRKSVELLAKHLYQCY